MSPRSKKQARAKKKLQKATGQVGMARTKIDAAEANNIYQPDPNQLDLVKAISSMELLNIAEKFDQYPGEELDLQQFVNIMKDTFKQPPCVGFNFFHDGQPLFLQYYIANVHL